MSRRLSCAEICGILALLGVVLCCLFPLPQPDRPAARRAACQSNLKRLTAALRMYAEDYDERLPPHVLSTRQGSSTLPDRLQPYHREDGYRWRCAEDRAEASFYDGSPGDTIVSYGYNWHALSPGGRGVLLEAARKPAETVAFVDTYSYLATPGPMGGTPPVYRHQKRVNVAWLDGHVRSTPSGILEQGAVAEEGKRLSRGIDGYVYWNLK